MSSLRTPIFGAAVVAGLVLAFYGLNAKDTIPETPVQPPRPAKPTIVAERATSARAAVAEEPLAESSARPADCLIEPSQVVKVNSSVEGVIAHVAAERGQMVRRGQVVAQLGSSVETVGLAVARARAANVFSAAAADARARYLDAKQQRNERVREYLARDSVEEIQANARAASMQTREAELSRRVASLEAEQSRRLLSERTVRSPIEGVVTERAMSPGEYRSNQASHILTIAQINPLHVEVFAPIAQLKSIGVGDVATVYPEDPVGGAYKARVKLVDRVFDAASGTFGLRLELPNPGNRLPAGLRCRIQFDA
jgi:RND family efflux transporter MFP subunit